MPPKKYTPFSFAGFKRKTAAQYRAEKKSPITAIDVDGKRLALDIVTSWMKDPANKAYMDKVIPNPNATAKALQQAGAKWRKKILDMRRKKR